MGKSLNSLIGDAVSLVVIIVTVTICTDKFLLQPIERNEVEIDISLFSGVLNHNAENGKSISSSYKESNNQRHNNQQTSPKKDATTNGTYKNIVNKQNNDYDFSNVLTDMINHMDGLAKDLEKIADILNSHKYEIANQVDKLR
jgi:hypothetical protein